MFCGFVLFSLDAPLDASSPPPPPPPHAAATTFGKFPPAFLTDIHAEIAAHAAGQVPAPAGVPGIVVHDSEVLPPEPPRAGGLVRGDAVSCLVFLIVRGKKDGC